MFLIVSDYLVVIILLESVDSVVRLFDTLLYDVTINNKCLL